MKLGVDVFQISKNWKLQRSYNWEIFLPDLGGITGVEVAKFCQDANFGDYNIVEVAIMRIGPYQAKYASFFTVEDIQLTFLKPVPDIVSSYFYAWRNLVVDERGYYYPKLNYSKQMYAFFYDTKGNEVGRFKFEDVFPKNLPSYRLSYGESKVVTMEVSLSVDRVYVEKIEGASTIESQIKAETELKKLENK